MRAILILAMGVVSLIEAQTPQITLPKKKSPSTAAQEKWIEVAREPIRTLRPDGSVMIRYPDGTKMTVRNGSVMIERPNGSGEGRQLSQVPRAFPAAPVRRSDSEWLEKHADSILALIRGLATNPSDVVKFLELELGLSVWEKLQRRTDALTYLLVKP